MVSVRGASEKALQTLSKAAPEPQLARAAKARVLVARFPEKGKSQEGADTSSNSVGLGSNS